MAIEREIVWWAHCDIHDPDHKWSPAQITGGNITERKAELKAAGYRYLYSGDRRKLWCPDCLEPNGVE